MRPYRRTVLAAGLVSAAVLGPTVAWYLAGSRDVARRGADLEHEALVSFSSVLAEDAERLGRRLEELRAAEARRPFYHYQVLYHDPRGAAQGLAVTPSPLAAGALDPLVHAHFQIDDQGRVTLPTVSDLFPELSTEDGFAVYCSFLAELQESVVGGSQDLVLDAWAGNEGDEEQVLVLPEASWEQIRLADDLYASLTGRREGPVAPDGAAGIGQVVVRVGPLRWHTMVIGRGPILTAMRRVVTPSGALVQGFAVASAAVAEWLGASEAAPELTPRPRVDVDQVAVPVSTTGWYLEAEAAPDLRSARETARDVGRQFRRVFAMTACAAILAGMAVVGIVAQADHLAVQRSRFAAAAAHQLRTPLSTLRLYGEMLSEGLGDPDRSRDYAGRVAREVSGLGRVVTNMLDLARLERGVALAEPVPGDLAAALDDCVTRLRPTLEEAGLAVTLEVEQQLPRASFDADALCQILHNLLDNAERYTRGCTERWVRITAESSGPGVRLAVTDCGPGIPRRLRPRLFRAFTRGGGGRSGLGLGLALARALAVAQGGTLELLPEGPGATFVLTLARTLTAERCSPSEQAVRRRTEGEDVNPAVVRPR